jgi:hypothetical protein
LTSKEITLVAIISVFTLPEVLRNSENNGNNLFNEEEGFGTGVE